MATLAEVSGLPVVAMSSSSGEGVEEVKRQLMHHVRLERERRAEEERES
jgi:Fe2+ transport system protein B